MSNETQHTPADVRELAVEIIRSLDLIARNYDGYGYGLPVMTHYDEMVDTVVALLRTPRGEGEAEALAGEILAELRRAREKFPGNNVMTLALVEEVGELAKATFEESRDRVRQEAIQVAVMAMRVVLDGDQTLDAWREAKGLDPLVV